MPHAQSRTPKPEARYGAIEGGGSKFLCAISDAQGQVLAQQRIPTRDPASTLAAVAAFFEPYRPTLTALGLACFGPLQLQNVGGRAEGRLLRTPKPGWSGTPLRATLEQALHLPVFTDTDVNGAALGEQRWGALRGTSTGAYITVGTGVGVGVLLGGRPLHGALHPELGHLRSVDASFAGQCPFHGSCIEGLVSAPAIEARTGYSAHTVPADHEVWPRVADTLAQLLHAVVLAYAPERIVLSGGVLAQEGLRVAVATRLATSLGGYMPLADLDELRIHDYVVAPELADQAGIAGAFALAGLHARTAPRPC
jgi:fructokinase